MPETLMAKKTANPADAHRTHIFYNDQVFQLICFPGKAQRKKELKKACPRQV